MRGRILGWVALGCVVGLTGCQQRERPAGLDRPTTVSTRESTNTERQTTPPISLARPPEQMTQAAQPRVQEPGVQTRAPSGSTLVDSQTQDNAQVARQPTDTGAGAGARNLLEDDDREWLSETVESARAGNARISPDTHAKNVTLASSSVVGRVKRVRKGTIEVKDREGNVYALRLDKRSRGLRQGRKVPISRISEGTQVRASFDLVGDGDTMARDIVLRR